jgi:NTE family protein
MTGQHALVLGGGGIAGIAWMTGLLTGFSAEIGVTG